MVKIMEPLMHLLNIVDGDKKPSLGYIYDGMHRARKGIKSLFKNNKRMYKQYTNIIKSHCDRQLRKDIHAAAYWLNPAFQYDRTSFCGKPEVMRGFLQVVSSKGGKHSTKLLQESSLFRHRLGSFGHELSLGASKHTQPSKW